MAAKKQSKSLRARQTAPAAGRLPIALSTAARGAVIVTSGSVLVFLFAAKRFL
jgi:hypothetical protein